MGICTGWRPAPARRQAILWMARRALVIAVLAPGFMLPGGRAAAQEARPITLAAAVMQALQSNLALRAAGFEVQITQAQLAQAQAAKLGTLAATASFTRTNEIGGTVIVIPPGTIGNTDPITFTLPAPSPNQFSARISYELPLYTGDRLEAQIRLASAGVRGATAALERVKQEVILQTRLAYFQVQVAQAGMDVAGQILAQAEESLRTAQARVRAGSSPRFDEIQADVNVANARQGLVRARNGVAVATQQLAAVIGLPVDTPLRPQEAMEAAPVRVEANALVARGLRDRPELAEHRARLEAGQAAIDLARAGGRPAVGLTAGPNAQGGGTGTIVTGWSVTLAATIPIFDGGVTRERIREAELRLEQQKVVEAQLRQRVELEVRQAALNLTAAAEELETAARTIDQAREALRIAQLRFREGVGTNLEVLSAQAALSQAEAARIQALFAFNAARAQLERAMGGPI